MAEPEQGGQLGGPEPEPEPEPENSMPEQPHTPGKAAVEPEPEPEPEPEEDVELPETDDLQAEIDGLQTALELLPDMATLDAPRKALREQLDGARIKKVKRDEGREKAEQHCAVAGQKALDQRDYPAAIAAFEEGIALETNPDGYPGLMSPRLTSRLERGLAAAQAGLAAQQKARAEAEGLVAAAEACMVARDHEGAIAAYQAAVGLDVNQTTLSTSYAEGVAAAKAAMADAIEAAKAELKAGESAMGEYNWESAIRMFTVGLAVKGTHDAELTAALSAALEAAEASLSARNAARQAAEDYLVNGKELLSTRDYQRAIAAFETGLALDTQSEDLTGRLEVSLEPAKSGFDAQERARAQASEYEAAAESCMALHNHKGAISAYEKAIVLDVNSAKLTAKYQDGLVAAQAAMAAAVEQAEELFVDGETAADEQNWEVAIEKYTAGLAVEGTHDDELTANLTSALKTAQDFKTARDSAREKAEGLLSDASGMLSSRSYEPSIEGLEMALVLDTQSDELTERLNGVLSSAKDGLAAQEEARAEANKKVLYAQGCMETHNHAEAIAGYEAALTLDVNSDELKARYQTGVEDAKAAQVALARAVEAANSKRVEGEAEVVEKNWELAIDLFTAGLAVDGVHDEECRSALHAALESAVQAMSARNKARTEAEDFLRRGDALLSSREYAKAISAFEAGLLLDIQSEELQQSLETALVKGQEALAAQEAARKEAVVHVTAAEACMAEFDHMGAIQEYELALTFDVNDTGLTQTYVVRGNFLPDVFLEHALSLR
eukprot:COSAG02_NODE_3932_length_6026_cov_5.753838_6_plen_783_part_00